MIIQQLLKIISLQVYKLFSKLVDYFRKKCWIRLSEGPRPKKVMEGPGWLRYATGVHVSTDMWCQAVFTVHFCRTTVPPFLLYMFVYSYPTATYPTGTGCFIAVGPTLVATECVTGLVDGVRCITCRESRSASTSWWCLAMNESCLSWGRTHRTDLSTRDNYRTSRNWKVTSNSR